MTQLILYRKSLLLLDSLAPFLTFSLPPSSLCLLLPLSTPPPLPPQ